MEPTEYLEYNIYLPDINNDNAINETYKKNLISLNTLVLVQFAADTVVVPKESSWFGFYADNTEDQMLLYNETKLYINDQIGLKILDQSGKLKFDSCPGDHMHITLDWFAQHVVSPYLNNTI